MAQQSYTVSENVRVEIRNCHNRVTVIGWDDAEHVSVENHLSDSLGTGGTKIRAESARGDLILRACGGGRHRAHRVVVRSDEFADRGQRIAQEVHESVRESLKGWRAQAHPRVKIKKHWGRWHPREDDEHEEEVRAEERPRGPKPGSSERQSILDAIARGELNVDQAKPSEN